MLAQGRTRALARRAATGVALIGLAGCFVVGSDLFGARERLFGSATPPARPSAFSRAVDGEGAGGRPTRLRSQPWWQRVARLQAGGASSLVARIGDDAIQWRVRARCRTGRLTISADGEPAPVMDVGCPAEKTRSRTDPGAHRLRVTADAPWSVDVEQQVDVPLYERPSPAMQAPDSRVVRAGALYRIDQTARGRVTIYELGSGRFALRMSDVYVTPNVDLELRLSTRAAPHSTAEFRRAPSAYVAPFEVTAGSLNFLLPKGVDPTRYRSLVVWCPPVVSAYGAATLRP